MNMKKTRYTFASLLAVFSLLVPTSVVYAANNSLEYDGESNQLIIGEDKEYFDSMKEMLPGDTREESFTITNNSDHVVTYYMYAKVPKEEEVEATGGKSVMQGLLKEGQLTLTFDHAQTPFYNGPISGDPADGAIEGTVLIKTDDVQYGITLCMLKSKETAAVKIKVSLPKTLGNEYMDGYSQVDWKFACEVNTEETVPTPTGTGGRVTPRPTGTTASPHSVIYNPTTPGSLAKTGILYQSMPQLIALCAVAAAGWISIDLIRRRRNKR